MTKDNTTQPPYETNSLREELARFFNIEFLGRSLGSYKYGVYLFYDYDGEPIYVGQTKESLRTRIRRHLTNQRTDAVAMSVLDPLEVFEIEVFPLPYLEENTYSSKEITTQLDALEFSVFEKAIENSHFNAILNEKKPNTPVTEVSIPESYRGRVVSESVYELRSHPDIRIARRASVLARLAQVISERQVQEGLRKTLWTQAQRLEWLASRRYKPEE